MKIANNILKHSLQNVYFLAGTPLAGKTTMSKALVEKHGFVWFDENYNGIPFKKWESIVEEKYQPHKFARDKRFKSEEKYDWDAHYARPAEEIFADQSKPGLNEEFLEFAIIELIKMSQAGRVVTDICMPPDLLLEISDYSRIACLLTAPHLVTTVNYGSRPDHRNYLDWIMSLNDPEEKIAKNDEVFMLGTMKTYEDVKKHNLFSIVRTEESTVEGMFAQLEAHFQL